MSQWVAFFFFSTLYVSKWYWGTPHTPPRGGRPLDPCFAQLLNSPGVPTEVAEKDNGIGMVEESCSQRVIRPRRTPRLTASVRLVAPSLAEIGETWNFTGCSLICSLRAMS